VALNEYDEMLENQEKAAPVQVNEYDALLDEQSQASKDMLNGSMLVAAQRNPDRHAEVLRLSKKLGVDADTVDRNLDLVKKKDLEKNEYDDLIDKSPKLAEWLQDPNNSAVAFDDLENLKKIEKLVNEHSLMGDMYDNALSSVNQYVADFIRNPALAWNLLTFKSNIAAKLKGEAQIPTPEILLDNPATRFFEKRAEELRPESSYNSFFGELGKGNYKEAAKTALIQGAGQVPQLMGILVAHGFGAKNTALGTLGTLSASGQLNEAIDKGIDPATSTTSAIAHGGSEMLFESLGTFAVLEKQMTKDFGKMASREFFKEYFKSALAGAVQEGAEEGATTVAQRLSDYVTGVDKNALDNIGLEVADSMFLGGLMGGGMSVPGGVAISVERQQRQIRAQRNKDFYTALGETVAESKLKQRLPEAQRKLVEQITKDAPVKDIYVPVNALEAFFQKDEKTAAQFIQEVEAQKAYEEAKNTGDDIKIPLATWIDKVAGTDYYQKLSDDVKFNPTDKTINELKSEKEEAKKLVESEGVSDSGVQAPFSEFKNNNEELAQIEADKIADQLVAAGQTVDAAQAQAETFKGFYKSMSSRFPGMTPADVANELKLQILGPTEAVPGEGQVFKQSPQDEMFRTVIDKAGGKYLGVQGEPGEGQIVLFNDPKTLSTIAVPIDNVTEDAVKNRIESHRKEYKPGETFFQSIDKTQSKEFKQWFGDSKVVDDSGKPLVVYHGTNNQFEAFQHKFIGERGTSFGRGFYFAANEDISKGYGKNVESFYIKIDKPVAFDSRKISDKDVLKLIKAAPDLNDALSNWGDVEFEGQDKVLKSALSVYKNIDNDMDLINSIGHDIFHNDWETFFKILKDKLGYDGGVIENERGRQYVVFNAEAIKSTKNVGTFDPNNPNIYKQTDQSNQARGQITLDAERNQAFINLFKSKNLSTFLHEAGHFYLELMKKLSKRSDAPEQFKADIKSILDYIGAESLDDLKTEHHEKFAKAFEAYLMEGKAPSKSLRKAFFKFKLWLVNIYRGFKLNVELTPEIRGVFDRMLATDEEIIAANETIETITPVELEMTGKKAEELYTSIEESRTAAEEQVTKKVMDDYQREQNQYYKDARQRVREDIEADVNEQRVYRALAFLQKGKRADGSDLPAGSIPFKLDKKALIADFGHEFVKDLPRGIANQARGLESVHHSLAAEMFGYSNGTEFINAIKSAENRNDLIERLTESKMDEIYPDRMKRPDIAAEALKAIHNDQRGKILRLQLEHMMTVEKTSFKEGTRRMAKRVPSQEAIKSEARSMLASKHISETNSNNYLRLEKKNAKLAMDAWLKGDVDAAFDFKLKELLNYELYRASEEIRETKDKAKTLIKKLKQSDEKISKNRDMDVVAAARSIAVKFFGPTANFKDTFKEDMEKIKRYSEDTYKSVQAMIAVSLKPGVNISNGNVDDYVKVVEAIESLWSLAKSTKQMDVDGKKLDLNDAANTLMYRLADLQKPDNSDGYRREKTKWDNMKTALLSFKAMGSRTESWSRAMGQEFIDIIFKPVSQGATEYRLEKEKYIKKFLDIIKPIEKTLVKKDIVAPELVDKDGKIMVFTGKAHLLGAILHTGNESNLSKLLRGYGWGKADENGVVDKTNWDKFIKRMWAEGVLTKADYDAVQAMWDLFEETKPQAQKAHKEMYGYFFDEITSNQIITPWGTYKGGYAPAKTDPTIVFDADIRAEKDAIEQNGNSFNYPTTGRGFTMSRVDAYAAPLMLNLKMIPSAIDHHLRFIHIEPKVKQVARLMWHKDLRAALNSFDETIVSDMIIPWLQRSATQKVEITLETGKSHRAMNNIARKLRSSVGLNTMAGNIVNTMQQLTGITVAAVRVKPRNLLKAVWSYSMSPRSISNDIQEKSKFMKTRNGSQIFDISKNIDDILLNPSKYEKAADLASKHGYIFQVITQNYVDNIVWRASYSEAVASGMTDAQAIDHADETVRATQGSFNAEDVSKFETGTAMWRMFTMFTGYFNMLSNLIGRDSAVAIRDFGFKKGASKVAYIYMFGFMLPAVMSELLVKAGAGKLDDDDDDEYIDDLVSIFFNSQFRTATAMFPFVGPVVTSAYNKFNDIRWDDRISTSPVWSALEGAGSVPFDIYKMTTEQKVEKQQIRDVFTLLGLLTGMPVQPLAKPLGYLSDVSQGKANPENAYDYTRGLVTGKSGE